VKKHKKYYTTGEIARYCEVDINTVKNWIKAGDLKGFKTPSGHFRVYRMDFISFITYHGFAYDSDFFGKDANTPDILVVDDDPKHKDSVLFLLKKLYPNKSILTADNGFDGYFIMREMQPRLVLLDLIKPVISGLDFIKTIRSNEKLNEVMLAIISAHLDQEILKKLKKMGVNVFINKPISEKKLKDAFKQLLTPEPSGNHQ